MRQQPLKKLQHVETTMPLAKKRKAVILNLFVFVLCRVTAEDRSSVVDFSQG
jgi:hypothetical protein